MLSQKNPKTRELYLKTIEVECIRESPEDLEPADGKDFCIQVAAEGVLWRFYTKAVRGAVNSPNGYA